MEVMRRELGWEYYGGKHYESIYTRFYQGFILKEKFRFDKRRSHLSCLINDGRLTRAEGLVELEKPAIEPAQLREDRAFVIKKLGISEAEFERIMAAEKKTFWDYPSYERDEATGEVWCAVFWVRHVVKWVEGALIVPRRLPRLPRWLARAALGQARGLGRRVRRKPRSTGG
jgi:hypothetical protein